MKAKTTHTHTHTHSNKGVKAFLMCCLIGLTTTVSFSQNANTLPPAGNVGVGTTTPSVPLDVVGGTKLGGTVVIDSTVVIKDSLTINKRLTIKQDIKVVGKSVFVDDVKAKANLRVLGTARMKDRLVVDSVARMKNKLVVDGLTRLNGDAKVFGDLKLPNLTNTTNPAFFLTTNINGKVMSLDKGGLTNAIYQPQQNCKTDQNGNILPVWKQNPNPNYGILYTGTDCPARVGLGTATPAATLDVKGRALFSGNVGIKTVAPEDYLQVGEGVGKMVIGEAAGSGLGFGTSYIGFNASRNVINTWSTSGDSQHDGGAVIYADVQGDMFFSTIPFTGGTGQTGITDATIKNNTRLFIGKDGGVGIGTTAVSGARLSVEGIIRARRVLVNNTWADYVFETNYVLMPLEDLETYITTKNHLPNVPTAQEVEKNGVDLGEVNKILLEKVEELTLYMIQMNKEIEQLKAANNSLKK